MSLSVDDDVVVGEKQRHEDHETKNLLLWKMLGQKEKHGEKKEHHVQMIWMEMESCLF